MNDDWQTLATFSWLSEAQMLRTRLESEGIATLLPEEHTAGFSPVFTAMQVRVQVRARDLERSRDLMAQSEMTPEESAEIDALAVGAGPSPEERRPKKGANWFRALIGLIFGVPMRRKNRD